MGQVWWNIQQQFLQKANFLWSGLRIHLANEYIQDSVLFHELSECHIKHLKQHGEMCALTAQSQIQTCRTKQAGHGPSNGIHTNRKSLPCFAD